MAARYRQIADDLRQRIAAGEWPVGGELPTIAELQDQHGVALNTVRSAQQVLVNEGLIETTPGKPARVVRAPAVDDPASFIQSELADALESLRAVQAAAHRHLGSPRRVTLERPDRPVERVWGFMENYFCRTCGKTLGGVTRGWVETGDFYETRIGFDGHDELGHDVTVTVGGPDLADNQEQALLVERWWEVRANEEAAAELLAAGEIKDAQSHAARAQALRNEHPGVEQLAVHVRTHSVTE